MSEKAVNIIYRNYFTNKGLEFDLEKYENKQVVLINFFILPSNPHLKS